MTMMQMKHWQDPVNAIIGLWLIVSPWILDFQAEGNMGAMANAVIIGLALIAAALGAIFVPRAWEEWTEFALGLWLIVSPWIVGFSTLYDARMNALIAGIAVAALALWTLLIDKDYSAAFRRDRAVH
jgi:hypothetical protein